ncbi:DUF924 family protein [Thalassotalea ganghwensis]
MFQDIINFWFIEIEPRQWWLKNSEFDASIKARFGALHQQAKACELAHWREQPLSSLAEIIILDQFSRNIYRDSPESFANDSLALALAQNAIAKEFDLQLPQDYRNFLYMPFMHSESQKIHQQAVKLFTQLGDDDSVIFEYKHKAIIDRFGRYPHRNNILGRTSTPEEQEFLQQPDSAF